MNERDLLMYSLHSHCNNLCLSPSSAILCITVIYHYRYMNLTATICYCRQMLYIAGIMGGSYLLLLYLPPRAVHM